MRKNMAIRITQLTVTPPGAQIYDESAFRVTIDDEGAGEFVIVYDGNGEIRIDPGQWEALLDAIDTLVKACK